jgi:DNA-binding SARP family transcriptional activator
VNSRTRAAPVAPPWRRLPWPFQGLHFSAEPVALRAQPRQLLLVRAGQPGAVPRRILCALLVRPGAVVPVDGLLDAAWGDDAPRSAERTLTTYITRLREALASADGSEPATVERRGAGYRVVVAADAVDAARLERILLAVKDVPPADAVPALREALGSWRGPAPFADLQDTAYPAAEAARLVEVHDSAVEALVAAHLESGDPDSAAFEAEARLGNMPFRERLWELLIVAL